MPPRAKRTVPTTLTVESTAANRNGLETIGEGRRRVIIERPWPEIDGGRYAIKRTAGDTITVECDMFADGHEVLAARILFRPAGAPEWSEAVMEHVVNDRWRGSFTVAAVGRHEYTILGWVDRFLTWEHQLHKRVEAGQELSVDLQIGANLLAEAAGQAPEAEAAEIRAFEERLRGGDARAGFDPRLHALMAAHLPRRYATRYDHDLQVIVDVERARFSSWYELFPRSTSPEPGRHGTFRDVINRLPYVAEMGFDVLYLTPIHPIGMAFRKGKDNSPVAQPGEPGSPYAIGSAEGGHKDIHPELGTLEDFRALVAAAHEHGMEIALDNAFQCSPDHPWVREHPEWFRARPDGTIQYAENPPKKYQDIYPIDFESSDWENLWYELRSYFLFWIEQGVTIFRVDNPHTKSFRFWEWCIKTVKERHPEAIFLSEAFTRPKVMYHLAKIGFTQSYTYFTWRTAKWELAQYMTELTTTEAAEYFRPNFWPNTHDILTPQFYAGHRSVFLTRAALAATMTANWGIYGPAYELMEFQPVQGREEYRDNEKYELRTWNLDRPDSLRGFIGGLNRVRRENPALQRNEGLRFHRVENNYSENNQIIAYSKATPDFSNIILVIVNLDPTNVQAGWVGLPLQEWGIDGAFQVHDQISDARYIWQGEFNYVELNPHTMPVHIFKIRRRTRDASGFEHFG